MQRSFDDLAVSVKNAFRTSSQRHDVPLLILYAIGWVETRWRHLEGDNGHAHGIMQINDNYHPRFRNDDYRGVIDYAAKYLRENFARRGDWAGAITEYNSGNACFEGNRVAACGRGTAYRLKVQSAMGSLRPILERAGEIDPDGAVVGGSLGFLASVGGFAPVAGFALIAGGLVGLAWPPRRDRPRRRRHRKRRYSR